MSQLSNVSFFTPISFEDKAKGFSETLLEYADDYFYLGGRRACVISDLTTDKGREVTYKDGEPSFLITALKVVSYFTLVLPLLVLALKTLLRMTLDFKLDDRSRLYGLKEAERTDKVKEIMAEKISDEAIEAYKKAISAEDIPEEDLIEKGNTSLRLKSHPNVRFYRDNDEEIEKLFELKTKMHQVCLDEELRLLCVPAVKLFSVEIDGTMEKILAEEHIAVNGSEFAQLLNYLDYSGLDKAFKQLITLIVKAELEVNDSRNIPMVDDAEDFAGDRRITLVKISKNGKAAESIFNLLTLCKSEEMIDSVIAEAARHGIEGTEDETAAEIKEKVMTAISARIELSKGIEVTTATKALVAEELIKRKGGDSSQLINFSLPTVPGLVFITHGDFANLDDFHHYHSVHQLLSNLLSVQAACLKFSLDRISVPHTKMILVMVEGKEVLLLAQQDLKIDSKQDVQQLLEKADGLDALMKQLIQLHLAIGLEPDPFAAITLVDSKTIVLTNLSASRPNHFYKGIEVEISRMLMLIGSLRSEKLIDVVIAQSPFQQNSKFQEMKKACMEILELEKGIVISPDVREKLQQALDKNFQGKEFEFHYLGKGSSGYSLAGVPDLIFIRSDHQYSQLSGIIENMIKGQKVIRDHKLDRLIIPQAKLLHFMHQGYEVQLIAQQDFKIEQDQSFQKSLMESSHLDEAVRQLATFIAITRFDQVFPGAIPVYDKNKIVLKNSFQTFGENGGGQGVFGDAFGSSGLLSCLWTESHINIAIEAAKTQGVTASFARYSDEQAYTAKPEAEREEFVANLLKESMFKYFSAENAKINRLKKLKILSDV